MDNTADESVTAQAEETIEIDDNTSPSQLQEVTLSANGTLADQTKITPMRGRSVKEYDEQLTTLKKENFNLKLRIYFLEERMGSTFRFEDKDNIVRKNIEYQVEIETLRKELDEKQDLLCQAVKALELEDQEHKKAVAEKEIEAKQFHKRIVCLEAELQRITHDTSKSLTDKSSSDSVCMYHEAFGLKPERTNLLLPLPEIQELQDQVEELETQLAQERENSLIFENEMHDAQCFQTRCENMEIELQERDKKLQDMIKELEECGKTIASYNVRIRLLEDSANEKANENCFKKKELEKREFLIQEQNAVIDELRALLHTAEADGTKEAHQAEHLKQCIMSRENTISELERRLEGTKHTIRTLENKLDSITSESKRYKDELFTLKQQRKVNTCLALEYSPKKQLSSSRSLSTPPNHDIDAHSVMRLQDEMKIKNENIKKLENDRKKTLDLIQTFITHIRVLEHDVKVLRGEKSKTVIDDNKSKRFASIMAKSEQYTQTHSSITCDIVKESSMEEAGANKSGIAEFLKFDDTSTLEWEKHVEGLLEILQDKEDELKKYQNSHEATSSTLLQKDNRISELEQEVHDLKTELSQVNKKLDEKPDKPENEKLLTRISEEKSMHIEKLENELRKQTANLQGIVNTELRDKNRELEILQNKYTEKVSEISQLEKDITTKDLQMKMLKDKISELGVQINLPCSLLLSPKSNYKESTVETPEEIHLLQEQLKASCEENKYLHKIVEELKQQLRNMPERDGENKSVLQLKSKYEHLQNEYEKSEKLRLETTNSCTLLTTRLEELAYFLDSLLKHKSVLGVLGIKQRFAIKQAIDQSLDLSKSLSVSILNDDHSLAQLSSISGLLNTTQNSVNVSLFDGLQENEQYSRSLITFNSHLNLTRGETSQNDIVKEQADIIAVLRAQIETMKKEIELRDIEICKQDQVVDNKEKSLKNDTDLVEALIDMQPPNKKSMELLSPGKIYQNLIIDNNQSESEAWSEPDRDVSLARIGLKHTTLNNRGVRSSNKSASVDEVTSESTADQEARIHNKTPSKRRSSSSNESRLLQDNINTLEMKLKEKENEILILQTTIMKLDNKSLEAKLSMSEEIAKLKNEKIDMENLLKDVEEKLKAAIVENSIIVGKFEALKHERDSAENRAKFTSSETEIFKQKLNDLDKMLNEKETEFEQELRENENKWKLQIQNIEQEAAVQLKTIQQATDDLKRQYETEYVQKTEVNKHIVELQMIYNELETLKGVLKAAEIKIKRMENTEIELKQKLQEVEEQSREKIIALKRELNEATVRISQAVLDRTKISNEKLKLESELRKVDLKENDKLKEIYEQEKEFLNMKNNLQKQLAQVEQQKSCLLLRVSELETINAELHNRLVKLQMSSTENLWLKANASSPPKISELLANFKVGKHSLGTRVVGGLMRQRSDMSGYASEDVLTDENECGVFNRSAPEAFHWFQQDSVNLPQGDVTNTRTMENSSPDLGIESDQGRFSSLETNVTNNATRPLLQTLELTASMNNLLSADQLDNVGHYCNIITHKTLEKENQSLKKTVTKLELGLEKTMSQLSAINQTKKQVEKAVCKQIHKTSIVLRQARANLDSGSETENKRK